jgi:hypothetical protein
MAKASAPSLPGLTLSQQSACCARRCCRGSMTISLAPLWRALLMRWAKVVKVARGLAPHRRMQRVFSKSGGGVGVPNVCFEPQIAFHVQICVVVRTFGLPNALARRSTHGSKSEAALPAGVARPKTTASAPCCARIFSSRDATVSSASSQEISTQPGFGSPFGRVRFIGWRSRSGEWTISGAAYPLMQMPPLGASTANAGGDAIAIGTFSLLKQCVFSLTLRSGTYTFFTDFTNYDKSATGRRGE